jgi:WD40 repeat protein
MTHGRLDRYWPLLAAGRSGWRLRSGVLVGLLVGVSCLLGAGRALAVSTLTPVAGSPFAAGNEVSAVAFSPNGGLVAVANSGDNTVSVFSVDPSTGALSEVSGSPFDVGEGPQSVAFSPSGGLLAVANNGDGTVSVFSVDPSTSALTEVSGSPFAVTDPPTSVAFGPEGGLLAAALVGGKTSEITGGGSSGGVAMFSGAPPVVSIASPAGGQSYSLGQSVSSSFSCSDVPATVSCDDSNGTDTVSGGSGTLNTTSAGTFSYTVTATDVNGQTATASISYTVTAPVGRDADVSVTLRGPDAVPDGASFPELVTINNAGPAAATRVLSTLVVPRGLTVTNADGGTHLGNLVVWSTASIAAGTQVRHTVTLKVGPRAHGTLTFAAAAASLNVRDPNYRNNTTTASITIGVPTKT